MPMTWWVMVVIAGVVLTLVLWAVFVYIALREANVEIPTAAFRASLDVVPRVEERSAMKILVPVDGSPGSAAAVREVAHCPLARGSTIELLYIVHSRVPVIPDFPPWAFTVASAHGEIVREQMQQAPELLDAAARYLQVHQHEATVVTKTVEGAPTKEILSEAAALGADRIVLGSHGRGRADRAILGATAGAVAAEAPCTVHIARSRQAASPEVVSVNAV
jgi:nucleotide-binding universal stress UspA family protein